MELPIETRILQTFLGFHVFTPYLHTLIAPQNRDPLLVKRTDELKIATCNPAIKPQGNYPFTTIRNDGFQVSSIYDYGVDAKSNMQLCSGLLAELG